MSVYQLLIFVHVLGAVGVFVAMGMEAVSLPRLQRAETPAEARDALSAVAPSGRLGPVAMLTALVSGVWMMAVAWRHQTWIVTAFIALVGMGLAGGAVTGRGMRRLGAALAAERGPGLSETFRSARSGVPFAASLRVRTALGIGILALMTMKPDTGGAWIILLAAGLAGLVAAVPLAGRRAPLAASPARDAS